MVKTNRVSIKIVIIRLSSIGDIVLTSPAVRCVRKHWPDAEIHFLTKGSFSGIVENNPHINYTHILDKSLIKTYKNLKAEDFNLIIDLHNNLRTRLLSWLLLKPTIRFHKGNIKKWLMVKWKKKIAVKHIVERYFDCLEKIGISRDEQGLEYHFLEKDVQMDRIPKSLNSDYIAFAIGGAHATKRLPLVKIQELVSQIEGTILLLGGPDDAENGRAIASINKSKIINLCGGVNLSTSAFLIKNCKKLITHDTGMMHIGAAFQKEILSIWGNTITEMGMYPYKTVDTQTFEVKNLPCRPCSKIGFEICPQGHFNCMNLQDLKAISREANK